MLHKNRSKRRNQLKLFIIVPLLALFMMSFSTEKVINYELVEGPEKTISVPAEESQKEAIAIITKDSSGDELDDLVDSMEEQGVTLKIKGVKRNRQGEITSIEISAKTGNSKTTYEAFDDEAIEPITIKVRGNSISISDNRAHKHGKDYFFKSEDGRHETHSKKSGTNVWIHNDHDDTGTEVIHEDDKIIIKKGDKVKEVKINKGSGANVFFSDDEPDDVEIIEVKEGEGSAMIISKNKDGKVIKTRVKTDKASKVIIDSEDGDEIEAESIIIKGGGKNEFVFGDSENPPLYIIDGKEAKKKEADKLSSDDIESINVMKGKSAEEKYGKKAKNGVIEITTKKN